MTTLADVAKTDNHVQVAKLFEFWLKERYQGRWPYRSRRDPDVLDDIVYLDKPVQDMWIGWRSACHLFDAKVDSILALPDEPSDGFCSRHRRPKPCPECSGSRSPG